MDLRKITKHDFINYGGDAIAFMTAIIALIGFVTPYMSTADAGTLLVISLFLTRGSTILANLIEALGNNETA